MTFDIVAGWTNPLVFSLLSQGATPSGTMASMTVELILRDTRGNTIDTTGDVTVSDSAAWEVTYTPDAADLVPGVYHARFKVTDAPDKIAYFPSAEPDIWHVRSET